MHNVVQLCLAANDILPTQKRNHTFLLLAIALGSIWQIASLTFESLKNKLVDLMIKQLLNSVITKYCEFVTVSQINNLPQTLALANN